MKKMLLTALLFLSLMVCVPSPSWAGGLDDAKTGLAAVDKGDYDKAIGLFTKAIESGELSQENLSRAYYNRGLAWGNKGDLNKAIADYTKAIEINPNYVKAYNNRGLAWYNKGDDDKAIADFTKVIEINPKHAKTYNNRGLAWGNKGDLNKAIADFNKAIEINTNYAKAYYNRGLVLMKKGNHDKAIVDFNKAIELDPQHAITYYNRGKTWRKKGNYEKAIADYTKAIELNPKFVEAYNDVAWLKATCPIDRYRDGTRAVELAEKALKLLEIPYTLDTLAAAYAEAGRLKEAIKTQERAITKLKQGGWTKSLSEFEEHLSSYKAGKPWREK